MANKVCFILTIVAFITILCIIWLLSKQGLTHPNCFAVLSYACMKEFINMNSICLLEAERNGIKQNNLIINSTTENRL